MSIKDNHTARLSPRKWPLLKGSAIGLRAVVVGFALFLLAGSSGFAQRGFGLKFAADFNTFFRPQEYDVIDGHFSNMVIGPFYKAYFKNGGVDVGINLRYKNNTDGGFPNLPLIMQDFKGEHNIGLTALEMDFKAGPRFGVFNPKLGYILGYRFKHEGFLEDGSTQEVNPVYLSLPLGASFEFPTGYGSVGAGVFWEIGLTNVIKKPDSFTGAGLYDGSKIRSFNAELFILFSAGKQEPRKPPPPPPDYDPDSLK